MKKPRNEEDKIQLFTEEYIKGVTGHPPKFKHGNP
jgi:hypothetical protein